MPDLVEQLERYAAAAAGSVPAVDPGRIPLARHRRRRYVLVAAVMMIVVGAGAVVVSHLDGTDPARRTTTEPSTAGPPSSEGAPGATTSTVPATRSRRTSPVVALAGSQYLVWSGEAGDDETSVRADGFAVDLTDRS